MAEVELTIDGRQTSATQGWTILQAARNADIYIPTLCAHPDLPPTVGTVPRATIFQGANSMANCGNHSQFDGCQLCVVEVEGEGTVLACVTPVAENMVINTDTPQLKELRQQKLAEVLANHPHACLICPQKEGCSLTSCSTDVPEKERCCPKFNDCELRKVAEYIGIPEYAPRYTFQDLPSIVDEPLFNRNYNLCIGCLRCVKACQELVGAEALGFVFDDNGRVHVGTVAPSLEESGCRLCGVCVEVCPTGALVDKIPKEKQLETLIPCHYACPVMINVPRYVQLIGEGKFAEALAVIRQDNPFPGICGRVCTAPCEDACRRGEKGEPIAIRMLKRAAYERGTHEDKATAEPTGKQVAIIGSGPAGLTAAHILAKMGHKVTIFEALPQPGGMMRIGIPEARLPRKVLDDEIDEVRSLGVDIKVNSRIDSLDSLFHQDYHAILVTIGAHQGIRRSSIVAAISGHPGIAKQFGLATNMVDGETVLEANPDTLATSREGVFAAGDAVTNHTSVVHTIASGKRAAISIDKFLGGRGVLPAEETEEQEPASGHISLARKKETKRPHKALSPEQVQEFGEEELGLNEEEALDEGQRCFRCDLRFHISPPILPPEERLQFDAQNISQVPETEGVYELFDEQKNIIYIKGTANLRQELEEQLEASKACYFIYEEKPMYTSRESELLQQFLQQHGKLPPQNLGLEEDLFDDDLF